MECNARPETCQGLIPNRPHPRVDDLDPVEGLRIEIIRKLANGSSEPRMNPIPGHVDSGEDGEGPLVKSRVGHLESRTAADPPSNQQHIDVEGPRSPELLECTYSSRSRLCGLTVLQQPSQSTIALEEHCGVEEIRLPRTDGAGPVEPRPIRDSPPPREVTACGTKGRLHVTQIPAETDDHMHRLIVSRVTTNFNRHGDPIAWRVEGAILQKLEAVDMRAPQLRHGSVLSCRATWQSTTGSTLGTASKDRLPLETACILPLRTISIIFMLAAAILAAAPGHSSPPIVLETSWSVPPTIEAIRALPMGATIRVSDVPLDSAGQSSVLLLERVRVFTDDAQLVIHRSDGDTTTNPPRNEYLRGSIQGRSMSVASMTVSESGVVRGLVSDGNRYWIFGQEQGDLGPRIRALDPVADLDDPTRGFDCGADQLTAPDDVPPWPWYETTAPSRVAGELELLPVGYTARVAVETDHEFYQLFGNPMDAAEYVGDLFAYASSYYSNEVNTSLHVSHISLWTTSADPWTQGSSGCALYEFGRYWNDNNGHLQRTIAHFLSGKSAGGGIAWVGVLCSGGFTTTVPSNWGCGLSPASDNYGGAYGFTGNISGSFNISNPGVVWDIMASSHEIGHNFNSPHTHCYGGIGGNSSPVDGCYAGECGSNGCFCGTASLPCANTGAGCGTIMSYCHLLTGGLSNISLTFGLGHPYGVQPERVPARMSSHVIQRANSYPSCLAPIQVDPLFADGFESGTFNAWSSNNP